MEIIDPTSNFPLHQKRLENADTTDDRNFFFEHQPRYHQVILSYFSSGSFSILTDKRYVQHHVKRRVQKQNGVLSTLQDGGDGHVLRIHYSVTLHGNRPVRFLGLYSLRRRRLISIGSPIINLRRSSDRLRFIMGIPIPVRRRLLGE